MYDDYDSVAATGPFLDWGNVPAAQDRRDRLLSPRYAWRGDCCPSSASSTRSVTHSVARRARWRIGSPAGRCPLLVRLARRTGSRRAGTNVRHAFVEDLGREKGRSRRGEGSSTMG
ncbi:hypothetical protein DL765_005305 [Monosporascus sp. GIB2]|nr:hypothetical protein DL765_005305 [Monosporascus sp. GIB2]